MFLSNIKGEGREPADTSLLLLPVAPKVHEFPALEEVMLIRDEVANMVWAIETTIALPSGEPRRGFEAARELRLWHERDLERRLGAPPVPPARQLDPFIPVHRNGDNRSVQLQRAAMLPHPPRRPRPPPAKSAPAPPSSAPASPPATPTSSTKKKSPAPASSHPPLPTHPLAQRPHLALVRRPEENGAGGGGEWAGV
jgi:hypothetical protein